jgi:hypothetical protein
MKQYYQISAILINKAIDYMKESCTQVHLDGIVGKKSVKGQKQNSECELFDYEYVDQRTEYDDVHYGHVYLPIGKGLYLKIGFYS